jgi:hypothetical protein
MDRPILFKGEMVRAILDDTKTQTRRVVKGIALEWLASGMFNPEYVASDENHLCPYGKLGDRLWVRETWSAPHRYDHLGPSNIPVQGVSIHYAATEERGGLRWRPSIHMPRWASRITLEITGVRVERLQDISEADAIAEGIENNRALDPAGSCHWRHYAREHTGISCPIGSYQTLWESINGADSWNANPWVWVVEFKRAQAQE